MSEEWKIKDSEGNDRNLSNQDVLQEITKGKIGENNFAWKQGMKEWKKCIEVFPEAFHEKSSQASPPDKEVVDEPKKKDPTIPPPADTPPPPPADTPPPPPADTPPPPADTPHPPPVDTPPPVNEKTELESSRENLNEEITSVMGELKKGKKVDDEWAKKFYSLNSKMIDHRGLERKEAAIQRTKEVGGQAMDLFSRLKAKISQKSDVPNEMGEGEEIQGTTEQANGFLQKRIVHKLFFPLNLLYLFLYSWIDGGDFEIAFYIMILVVPLYCMGTVFYWLLARLVAQIKIATFLNTFLVLGISSFGFTIIFKIIGMIADAKNFLKLYDDVGIWGMVAIILILLTTLNTVAGKLVWRYSWVKCFVPAIIVTIIYTIMIVLGIKLGESMIG